MPSHKNSKKEQVYLLTLNKVEVQPIVGMARLKRCVDRRTFGSICDGYFICINTLYFICINTPEIYLCSMQFGMKHLFCRKRLKNQERKTFYLYYKHIFIVFIRNIYG